MNRLIQTSVFAVATLVASHAFAADSQSVAVSTAGVNFQSRTQSEAVLTKIVAAAEQACRTNSANPDIARSDTTCVRRAVSDAVRSANHPQLTAAFSSAPATVLTSN